MLDRVLFSTGSAALLAGLGLLLAACSTIATDTGPDADRRFYEARCGVCHVPFAKRDFAPGDWPALVAEFGPRAGLTKSQRARVLSYLTSP